MPKRFNTAGLCFPADHYMVDPMTRLTEVEKLIAEKLYFTLHAPRQTGKTTYLHALTRKLNAEGKYITVVASFERAGYGSVTVENANEIIIDSIYSSAMQQLAKKYRPENPTGKKYLDLKYYLDRLGLSEGYLVAFDPGKGDWEKKLYMKELEYNQKKIIMVGC